MHMLMVIVFVAAGFAATLTQISALVGFLLPHAVAVIQRQHWSNTTRAAVGIACCAIAAFITAWAKGSLDFTNWTASFLVVFLMAQTSYVAIWKPSGITQAIESKTGGGVSTGSQTSTGL